MAFHIEVDQLLTGQTSARHGSATPRHHPQVVYLEAVVSGEADPSKKPLPVTSPTRLDTKYPTLGKLAGFEAPISGWF